MTAPDEAWQATLTGLSLVAIDPGGLGGAAIRLRAGPVMEALEEALSRLPGARTRIHAGLSDTRLFGGLDLGASIAAGEAVFDPGLAATPARLLLPMAERAPREFGARLAQVLDRGLGHALVLMDESATPDEAPPRCLTDRLAFRFDLEAVPARAARVLLAAPSDLEAARLRLPLVRPGAADAETLVRVAARFGIDGSRPPLFALRAARALAALEARDAVSEDDLRRAAELVFAPLATQRPEQEEADSGRDEAEAPDTPPEDADAGSDDRAGGAEDILVEAVEARLPAGLLDRLAAAAPGPGRAATGGAGGRRRGQRRGRPLPPRPGRPDGRARIDVVATLRAAAPWQKLRGATPGAGGRLALCASDIRLRLHEDRAERLLIFLVDASGSAAMARLRESKGAVQLLLSQAYSRRDQVALVAFRGTTAETLLPPTRSLVQAKRRLAALPGGGGTPLAAGLVQAAEMAGRARSQGLTPALVLLTDGRANVALGDRTGREAAQEDAHRVACSVRQHCGGVVIDTRTRPGAETTELARHLGMEHVALPLSDAESIRRAVDARLPG